MKVMVSLTMLIVIVLSACAERQVGTSGQTPPPRHEKTLVQVAEPSANASMEAAMAPKPWEAPAQGGDPVLGGVPMTLGEATPILPFSPVVPPADVGQSPTLIASDPDRADKKDRGIAWLYQESTGPFGVIESAAELTEQQLE